MVVSFTTTTLVARVPPNVTEVVPALNVAKLLPVIVTDVLPASAPDVGLMLDTIGGGGGVTPIVVEAPLLPGFGSDSLPLRLTTAWNDGPDVGLTTMVPLTVAPAAMFPMAQVINVVLAEQVP